MMLSVRTLRVVKKLRARVHETSRRHRFFFGVPIETSISPIKGEMLALHRLTGGILTSFTADY